MPRDQQREQSINLKTVDQLIFNILYIMNHVSSAKSTYERYGNYIINKKEPLGIGKFGTVWTGYHIIQDRDEQCLEPVAIKETTYDAQNLHEITTLQMLQHPNIIRYIDYKISKQNLFLVMELCKEGTLEDLLMEMVHEYEDHWEGFVEKVVGYFKQIVSGVRFMYHKNILHRDIKPSNMLVKNNIIKIADFGTSKLRKQNEMIKTLVGTPLFASPQILQLFAGQEQSYTEKSDIWSLGLILYFMFHYQKQFDNPLQRLKESLPWKGKSPLEVLQNIKNQPLKFRNDREIPENIVGVIKRMLEVDVEKRMSFEEFFMIPMFREKRLVRNNSMEQSQIILELEESMTYDNAETMKYSTTLHKKPSQPQSSLLKREDIDSQILKILELKASEGYQETQISDALYFYKLIKEQSQNSVSSQSNSYSDLLLQLNIHLYQLLIALRFYKVKMSNSSTIIRKSIQNKKLQVILDRVTDLQGSSEMSSSQEEVWIVKEMVAIREKYFAYANKFDEITYEIIEKLKEMSEQSNPIEKESTLFNILSPLQPLKKEAKFILLKKMPIFMSNQNQPLKINAIMPRSEIYCIYELINMLAFDFCWKTKNIEKKKRNITKFFENYKQRREKVKMGQIVSRIIKGLGSVELT